MTDLLLQSKFGLNPSDTLAENEFATNAKKVEHVPPPMDSETTASNENNVNSLADKFIDDFEEEEDDYYSEDDEDFSDYEDYRSAFQNYFYCFPQGKAVSKRAAL